MVLIICGDKLLHVNLAIDCMYIWSNTILCVSVKVFLNEINM